MNVRRCQGLHAGLVPALLCLAGFFAALPAMAQGNDDYLPFVEPLQVTQKRAYYAAAPTGRDDPLGTPVVPLTAPGAPQAAAAESRIEAGARSLRDAPDLAARAQLQTLRDELQQFGYDIFSRAATTFAPVDGIPVPADYRIGPGDHLVVQLFGKRNVEYNLVVTRDGKVLIPEFGPVAVGGLSFAEAETLITSGFDQRVIGARAVVTMGRLRTIQIRVAGDVRQPGVYTVGGLSSLVDALLATGGVAGTGTLRDIHLIRDGGVISRLDLYSLLLGGRAEGDRFLQHHDTIFVPPIGDVVYVGGEVQRPAIYELRGESTLGEAIAMAGGLLPTASLENSHIERIDDDGRRRIIDFRDSRGASPRRIDDTAIRGGDVLRILALGDRLEDTVQLSGRAERPGAYQFRPGLRLSSLLPDSRAFLPGVDTRFAVIERNDPLTLETRVLYADPLAAMQAPGTAVDLPLAPRDHLRLLALDSERSDDLAGLVQKLERQSSDPRAAAAVTLRGAIRHRGRMPLSPGARVLDLLALGGGLRRGVDGHSSLIVRREPPGLRIEVLAFSIDAARRAPHGDRNPRLVPGDRVIFLASDSDRAALLGETVERLRAQTRFGEAEPVLSLLGEAENPGDYPLLPGMRASDLVCLAGGLSRRADGLEAALTRAPGGEHLPLDSEFLATLCRQSRQLSAGRFAAHLVDRHRQRYGDDRRNPRLAAGDQLALTRDRAWREPVRVTLSGEVTQPGVYAVHDGETLCELLRRAGGLSAGAYAFGAEFTRESVRAIQQQTLDALQDQLDDLMIELSLSHAANNDEKASHEWAGKQDTLRVIRQLERAEASGRMVVDLERVQRCRARHALALENGDRLHVPREPDHVQVSGQVYVPTAHLYDPQRSIADYIELSGGATVIGRERHAYVVQANGEVLNLRDSRNSRRGVRARVMPGARIYVPIDVDRMNGTERAQSWVSTLAQSAILAGVLL